MFNSRKSAAALLALAFAAAACGSSKGSGGDASSTTKAAGTATTAAPTATSAAPAGAEFIDGAQLPGGKPSHIDPGFTSELDGAQITTALYDGLTDFSNGANGPELKPLVAESWKANDTATQFVFKIKAGQNFSNGEAVLPSSFARGWNRAADPALATDYSYLFTLV